MILRPSRFPRKETMIGLLPEEIMDIILEFADPSWVHNLSIASNGFHQHVLSFYKSNAHKFLRPGGKWYASLKSKRTRSSLQNTSQRISYAPMGLHSILHQTCAGCKKKFMAAVHKDFGIIAHAECIRHYLINTYYFGKFGMTNQHFSSVPFSELAGYSPGSYGRGTYSYMAVWKDKTNGIVPYEWTAHYLFHGPYRDHVRHFLVEKAQKEREAMERRQAQKEEAKRQRNESQKQIRKAYRERITTLMENLKPTMTTRQVRDVLRTKLPDKFSPNFFKLWDVLPDFFTAERYKEAVEIISNLDRLLKHLTVEEIATLNHNDLGKSVEALYRVKVKLVLGEMVEKIHQRHTPPPVKSRCQRYKHPKPFPCGCGSGRLASALCENRQCGVCCQGCHSRHRS